MSSRAGRIAATGLVVAAAFAAGPSAVLAQEALPPKVGGVSRGSPPATLDEQYFRAFYEETGLRDFTKAADAYAKVAEAAASAGNRDLQVKSLLGRGRCLRVMDKQDEAREAFAKALALDPENVEAKTGAAPDATTDVDLALRASFRNLVAGLGGALRDQVKTDLLRIGARAIPTLEEDGLRSLDVGVVAESAMVLAQMDAPGARAALARAFNDPKVTYPRVLIAAMGALPPSAADADSAGRVALLREILRVPDVDFRSKALRSLTKSGFPPRQSEAVAAVLGEYLSKADDGWKKWILGFSWGASVSRELLPTMRVLLATGDSGLRAAALGLFDNAPKEMAPEDVAAVRRVLEQGTPAERMTSIVILDFRGLLPEAERGALLSDLLAREETVAEAALGYIRQDRNAPQPGRWSPACAPGVLAGVRRAIDGEYREDLLQQFAQLINQTGASYSDDDLVDLVARCTGKPRTSGFMWVEDYAAKAAAQHWQASRDPEAVSAAFLKGFQRLRGTGRQQWLGAWSARGKVFTWATVLAVAEDPGEDPASRFYGYTWILDRGVSNLPAAPPALLDNVERDLGNTNSSLASKALEIADGIACPALAPGVRGLLRANPINNKYVTILNLLVKCDGKGALPELREYLGRNFGESYRDLLVRIAGADALPDLVDLARNPAIGPTRAIASVGGGRWSVGIPREMVEPYLDRLPAELRTGDLLTLALGSVSDAKRKTLIRDSLASEDPRVVAAAAAAVRAFNLLDFWQFLVPLLDHADETVRREAQNSLDAIRRYRDLKASFERYGEKGPPKALDEAMALAGSERPEMRKAAALALGALGDKSGVAILLRLAGDGDASVREAALAALDRMGGRGRPEEKPAEAQPAGGDGK